MRGEEKLWRRKTGINQKEDRDTDPQEADSVEERTRLLRFPMQGVPPFYCSSKFKPESDRILAFQSRQLHKATRTHTHTCTHILTHTLPARLTELCVLKALWKKAWRITRDCWQDSKGWNFTNPYKWTGSPCQWEFEICPSTPLSVQKKIINNLQRTYIPTEHTILKLCALSSLKTRISGITGVIQTCWLLQSCGKL